MFFIYSDSLNGLVLLTKIFLNIFKSKFFDKLIYIFYLSFIETESFKYPKI